MVHIIRGFAKTVIAFVLLLCTSVAAEAQFNETIRAARPGSAIGPFTVGRKVFQVQAGINFGRTNLASGYKTNDFRNVLVMRYGIRERIEISGVVAYSRNSPTTSEIPELSKSGISAAQIGVRFNLRDGKGSGPNIGLQSRLKLNTLSEDYHQKELANVTVLSLTQKIGKSLGLMANSGISWSGNGDDPIALYALKLNIPFSMKVVAFIENFGTIKQGDLTSRFDTGLGYLVNNNLKLDARIGLGDNRGVEDYFGEVGVSWRMVGNR